MRGKSTPVVYGVWFGLFFNKSHPLHSAGEGTLIKFMHMFVCALVPYFIPLPAHLASCTVYSAQYVYKSPLKCKLCQTK